jgi:transposase InsO family protein
VIDDYSRECVALVADTSLSGARIGRELDIAILERMAKPITVVSNNVLCWEAAAGKGQQVSLRRL